MFAWCAFPSAKSSPSPRQVKPSNSSWHRHRPLSQNKQPTHSYNNNNIAFLLMMTYALSYAQRQLWLRFFFLSISLLIVCWESVNCDSHGGAYCMHRYTMRYAIYSIRYLPIDFYFSLSFAFFCNWWGFICVQLISRSVSCVLLIQNVSGNGIPLWGDSANCLIIGWHVKIQVLVIYRLLDKLR